MDRRTSSWAIGLFTVVLVYSAKSPAISDCDRVLNIFNRSLQSSINNENELTDLITSADESQEIWLDYTHLVTTCETEVCKFAIKDQVIETEFSPKQSTSANGIMNDMKVDIQILGEVLRLEKIHPSPKTRNKSDLDTVFSAKKIDPAGKYAQVTTTAYLNDLSGDTISTITQSLGIERSDHKRESYLDWLKNGTKNIENKINSLNKSFSFLNSSKKSSNSDSEFATPEEQIFISNFKSILIRAAENTDKLRFALRHLQGDTLNEISHLPPKCRTDEKLINLLSDFKFDSHRSIMIQDNKTSVRTAEEN